jgi:hypothetical protein
MILAQLHNAVKNVSDVALPLEFDGQLGIWVEESLLDRLQCTFFHMDRHRGFDLEASLYPQANALRQILPFWFIDHIIH